MHPALAAQISPMPRILAISGSLRAGASHTAVLEAARLLADPGVVVTLDDSVGGLPWFTPDLDRMDGVGLPAPVAQLRARVGAADAILLSVPEYAHGVPGAFKNLLDWLVASSEFQDRRVGFVNPSPLSRFVTAQVAETVRTMNARVVESAWVTVPLSGRPLTADAIAADDALASPIRAALRALVSAEISAR